MILRWTEFLKETSDDAQHLRGVYGDAAISGPDSGNRAPHATGMLTAVRTDAGDLKLITWKLHAD